MVKGHTQDLDGGDLEHGVFRLAADEIDVAACLAQVGHDSCGGNALFLGTTRATNRGEDVRSLDYEAFEAMAGPEMERIFGDCRTAFGPGSRDWDEAPPAGERRLRMLVVHRTGTVGVGAVSVLVAAASPHREVAFRACRFLIDELKARLPVWKKEVYGDGHHWIGDRS